ncbi:Tetratricopeptide TPR_2 repeat protein [Magnetococcus marinus MC-1]|uniref:Tetratricopeptide TPR_2 repeat protein n=1 Tax=Magnetococcus marinus (strain ATCC BAA-1437 / JCM 17883 / MC-1) TaxID=156889 RepID=A0L9U3_MAGMM|nr:tetratricopeptide repeat protein [Magnetococcus marinus]ABK44736.1 Tetratricopeptide TPR_2 repeat protein [Magnetococcus marinus MC-1]
MLEQKFNLDMLTQSTSTMTIEGYEQEQAELRHDTARAGHENVVGVVLHRADEALEKVISRLERHLGFIEQDSRSVSPSEPVEAFSHVSSSPQLAADARSVGISANRAGAYDKAIEALGQVWHKDGQRDAELAMNLGFALLKKGRLKEAARVLSIPFHQQPQNPALATLLGKALLFQGLYEDAAKVMVPAARKHGSRFNLHFYLGLAFAKMSRFADAQKAWQIASSIRPNDGETRRMLKRVEGVLQAS